MSEWISPQSVIRQLGLAPLKSLGQNFMQDKNVLDFMLRSSDLDPSQDAVVEIGPGTGALTQYLLPHAMSVCVFELDHGLGAYLNETYASDKFKVIPEDILASKKQLHRGLLDFFDEQKGMGRSCKLVSNLPYNILTPLLWNLLLIREQWCMGVFLVQREFAERLRAKPSDVNYAPLSIFAQLTSKVEVIKQVSKNSFWPSPDVESSIVRLTPLKEIDLKPEFLDFVKLGFSQRRKTLTKIMKSKFPVKEMEENLENLGFSGKSRAESLDPASLLALWLKLTSV
jgi:16S rRNA (adenine1518-N6/adenine1519-N6)-dimethyltransferase